MKCIEVKSDDFPKYCHFYSKKPTKTAKLQNCMFCGVILISSKSKANSIGNNIDIRFFVGH